MYACKDTQQCSVVDFFNWTQDVKCTDLPTPGPKPTLNMFPGEACAEDKDCKPVTLVDKDSDTDTTLGGKCVEKKCIGLELHDGIMNKLVSTRLNLSILSISSDEATVKKCLKYIKDIQNIEKEIRNVAHNLNQEVFYDSNSFNKLLQGFIKEHNKTSRTIFKMEVNPAIDWNTVSNSKKMNLYRIIQEASHNISKHAKAKKATINIIIKDVDICLTISDDGIGFNASASENGIGLKNMKYRIKLLRGKFKIHSKPNSGTSINITIPLKEIN